MNKMLSNMKIGVKLALGFGVTALLLAIVLFSGLNGLSKVNEEVTTITEDLFPKTVMANEMIDAINDNARALRNLIISDDPEIEREGLSRFEWAKELVNKHFATLTETVHSDKGKELLAAMQKVRMEEYFPAREKLMKEYFAGNKEKVNELLFGELRDAQNKYLASIKDIINYQTDLVNTGGISVHDTYDSANALIIAIGIIALSLVIAFAWFITKSIVKPVLLVKERMAQLESVCLTNFGNGLTLLAKGDLSAEVEKATKHLNLEQNDEVGQMAKVFDNMLTKAQAGIDAYELVRNKVNQLVDETGVLIEAGKEGKLNTRGNAVKFEGGYRKIVQGINDTLDAVILPVKEGSDVLAVMAQGDLTARVTGDYKGDHQIIKNSINQLGDSLSNVIGNITEAVQATASASTQISSSSEEMAAGAQEQSAQTHEVASAVEQMTGTILETTRNADGAAKAAKNAGNIAKEGGSVVNETIQGMIRIAEVVQKSAATVQLLGKSSDQIGEIVQVIDDIADQTNLLALNAAIEAARAGEQGRGFAVVADEVRKLAERTTKATKEIAGMIKQIQRDTTGAVESMQQGTVEVDKGKELADKAGESLKQIITGAEEVVDIASQVAVASQEQSAAAEQISKNIESISSVTQQSAAGVQQIARAAEDLNRLTDNLQNMISQFKISVESGNGSIKKLESKSKLAVRSNGVLIHA